MPSGICIQTRRRMLVEDAMTAATAGKTVQGDDRARRRSIAFLNWAHALDHFVLLIYPTVVIGLEVIYRRPYAELIALSTAAFVAFGVIKGAVAQPGHGIGIAGRENFRSVSRAQPGHRRPNDVVGGRIGHRGPGNSNCAVARGEAQSGRDGRAAHPSQA